MFNQYNINLEDDTNIFSCLLHSCEFENIIEGRVGANLAVIEDGLIPLVRTTTNYQKPIQKFQPIHHKIINKIKEKLTKVNENHDFQINNALIEMYDSKYWKMGFHSDQSLDLDKNSYIYIYSCYEYPQKKSSRKFVMQDKKSKICTDITMIHDSVIVFSTKTNKEYVHKIILDEMEINNENRWIGVTFRLSQTFIKFDDNTPYILPHNIVLKFGNEDEKKEFLKLKGKENSKIDFNYPAIYFTISHGDLLIPKY